MVDGGYSPSDAPIVKLSILQCLIKRPGMYTPHGSVEEVLLLLDGYDLGLLASSLDAMNPTQSTESKAELDYFRQWMRNKAGLETKSDRHSFSYMLEELQQAFSSDADFFRDATAALENWPHSRKDQSL